ncbi:MAG: DUF2779 domain-containing protein [Acidobacteriota bacterium]
MRLSKSRFVAGLQCHKRLYLLVHEPELVGEPDQRMQARFDQGIEVGRFARELFQEGVLVETGDGELREALSETSRLMAEGKILVIFEATFDHQKVLVRVDILQRIRRGERWRLIEVKSSSNRKDYYLADVAIQRFVLEGLGFKVDPCLMLLNRDYVFDGKSYDLGRLFKIVEVTPETDALLKEVPAEIQTQLEMLSQETAPDDKPGPQCTKPFRCEFFNICNRPVPVEDVSLLPRLSQSKFEKLTKLGVTSIRDIPADFSLTKPQQHARAAAVSGKAWFSKDLKKKLGELRTPLYFMDFETLGPAIPRFAGMRPFEPIPFQWSVHVRRKPESELEHYEFLAEDASDPRAAFLKNLRQVIGDTGHILVYNKAFESGVLGKLAERFPEHKPAVNRLQARLWDLLPVIRSHTYHIEYRGSFSLKYVLPALVPEMSYEAMGVSEGEEAGAVWDAMIHGRLTEEEKKKAKRDLLAYCCQDTLAMVRLLEVLEAA